MEASFGLAEPADLSISSSASVSSRVTSIDAVRGLVMFTMIYVNDIAGASPAVVPAWMRHYHGPDGMTFVDLVFPAFLFIVGMSIPLALGARIARGASLAKCLSHVLGRTLALLFIGVMMVNGRPDSSVMGWSASLWSALLYLSAILWCGSLSPARQSARPTDRRRVFHVLNTAFRVIGFTSLVWLALAYRGEGGRRIVTLSPFSLNTEWYGILGLIGWAYLVSAIVFLLFRARSTALLACMVLLFCLYPASRTGTFEHFVLARYISIGEALGSTRPFRLQACSWPPRSSIRKPRRLVPASASRCCSSWAVPSGRCFSTDSTASIRTVPRRRGASGPARSREPSGCSFISSARSVPAGFWRDHSPSPVEMSCWPTS